MMEHDHSVMQSVSDEAAEWFIRLKDCELSAFERRRYVRWLKHSPSHISEFMRLCQLYGRVKRAKVPLLPPGDDAQSNVIELMPSQGPLSRPGGRPFDLQVLRVAILACAAVLIGGVVWSVQSVWSGNRIETQISEWRHLQLADGSVVSAGPRTLLQVDFSAQRRVVRLQRGEAMFQVAEDAARPFLVDADMAFIHAFGTKFGVTRNEGQVIVTVAHGKAAVTRGDPTPPDPAAADRSMAIALVADEQVSLSEDASGLSLQVRKVNADAALAWARGRLIFQSETLAEAVEEFNRRNRTQIELGDPAIATWQVCCAFDAADPETFAEAVAVNPGIALLRERPGVLKLVPENREPPAPAAGDII